MATEAPKPKKQDPGAPAWMATFADMMSLLLCFFVLLLTFSEIDAAKFRETQGSLKMAFGVQKEERFDQVPMGTSIVAQEYSPGEQQIMDFNILGEAFKGTAPSNMSRREQELYEQDMKAASKQLTKLLKQIFKDEMKAGQVSLKQTPDHNVMLRMPGEFLFQEGKNELRREFVGPLIKLSRVSAEYADHVAILGHAGKKTGGQAKSKWAYTTERASILAQQMIEVGESDPTKFLVMGHGDTRPANPEVEERDKLEYSDRIELVMIPNPNK